MFQSEFDQFKALMSDLCTAFNRPYTDDVVRVFWDALKAHPLAQIRNRIRVVMATNKKFPTPLEVAPQPVEATSSSAGAGPSVQEKLADFVLKNYRLSPNQLRLPWTYIGRTFDAVDHAGKMRSHHGVEITGVVVPADGEHPGYRVMVVDMQLEDAA